MLSCISYHSLSHTHETMRRASFSIKLATVNEIRHPARQRGLRGRCWLCSFSVLSFQKLIKGHLNQFQVAFKIEGFLITKTQPNQTKQKRERYLLFSRRLIIGVIDKNQLVSRYHRRRCVVGIESYRVVPSLVLTTTILGNELNYAQVGECTH